MFRTFVGVYSMFHLYIYSIYTVFWQDTDVFPSQQLLAVSGTGLVSNLGESDPSRAAWQVRDASVSVVFARGHI